MDRILVPIRWARERPVVPAAILCALLWFATGLVGTHRLPGRRHELIKVF